MDSPGRSISELRLGFVGLMLLFCSCFFVWSYSRFDEFGLEIPKREEVFIGLVFVIPLLLLNWVLIRHSNRGSSKLAAELKTFRNELIAPLVRAINDRDILLFSFFAGVGEELFFRGVLQYELGLLVSSVLFSAAHFGPALGKFPRTAVVYGFAGLYLGLLYDLSGSLWVVMVCHAFYDVLALSWFKSLLCDDSD